MSPPEEASDRELIAANLDTERRRLDRIEAALQSALDEDEPGEVLSPPIEKHLGYDELTAANLSLREANGWNEVDLLGTLPAAERAEWDGWLSRRRLSWTLSDFATVGLCGVVGSVASVVDQNIDAGIRGKLNSLRDTPLLQSWEKAGKRLPIDYMGPGFGGPHHRMRSAGHDLGRPLAALRQIRSGQFDGVIWEGDARIEFKTSVGRYIAVPELGEALTVWLKHLIADFVTPMSLPLPGWTKLYELPSRKVRIFAQHVYRGNNFSDGLNLRSAGADPTLSLLSTEAIVRTAVHGQALIDTGSPELTQAQTSKRAEMLLAAHSFVGAFCLGHAAFAALATPEGPLALRHVNIPVLLRAGRLAWQVHAEAKGRDALAPPSWQQLLERYAQPWQLDSAEQLDQLAASTVGSIPQHDDGALSRRSG